MLKGTKMTNEQRERISEGRKRHALLDLPECNCAMHNKKMDRTNIRHSEETKEKIRKSMKGHIVSEETRIKISESLKNVNG